MPRELAGPAGHLSPAGSAHSEDRGRVSARLAVWLVVLGAVVFAALYAGTAGALAATPRTSYEPTRVKDPEPKEQGHWGERMAAAKDLNGDGVKDLFIATHEKGRVYLLSGKDRTVLREIVSPDSQLYTNFGTFISVLGDVNEDGKDDVAVGANAHDNGPGPVPVANAGKVWVFSGGTGEALYSLEAPDREAGSDFGARLGRAGDINNDGKSEVLVGASGKDVSGRRDQGRAYIFDGAAPAPGESPPVRSTPLRTLDLPPEDQNPVCEHQCGRFGHAVQGPGDTDGDGVEDQLVSAPYAKSNGRMYLFNGATGNVERKIGSPDSSGNGARFGFQDAAPLSPGDVNEDGNADIYAGGIYQDGASGEAEGRGWVFNGKTGELLYRIFDPSPEGGGQFGWSMSTTDYNRDGRPDLYIGQSPHHRPDLGAGNGNGGAYVFDGRPAEAAGEPKRAKVLRRLELPESDRQLNGFAFGPNLGWSLAAPGDLNGDGEPDYVAAAPFWDSNSPARVDEGLVYVFPSGPECPAGTSEGVNCTPLAGGGFEYSGTAGDDTIVGTDKDDVIVSGGGNDVIVAQGGNDAVNAGAGNDYVSGGEGNDRISGSTGNDYLVGASG
ncbi:MAG: FG-GAP repeat protein, partial [Chloroflexia bacterium]|nr:FG-GAP repeat protein [Chloroflexia bacterium]